MSGFRSLIEVLVSGTVDVAGNGAVHSGKGLLVAGARRIGWAGGGSSSRQGKRFAGHSIARRSLGSGFGGVGMGGRGPYDPVAAYKSATLSPYQQAARSGSGAGAAGFAQDDRPAHLFGRPTFQQGSSPLGRNSGHSFVKNRPEPRSGSWAKNPRGHIKF